MITEESIEGALDFLRDSALKAAKAKGDRIYMQEFRKVIKSQIMREHKSESVGAQEAIAYSDPRYTQHLESMQTAIEKDEYHTWMMTAAEARISAWQTQSRMQRDRV